MHPEEYYSILRKHGNLHVYGEGWDALDFKSETKAFVKSQCSFKLSEARMLSLTSEKVGFKTTYAVEYSGVEIRCIVIVQHKCFSPNASDVS